MAARNTKRNRKQKIEKNKAPQWVLSVLKT